MGRFLLVLLAVLLYSGTAYGGTWTNATGQVPRRSMYRFTTADTTYLSLVDCPVFRLGFNAATGGTAVASACEDNAGGGCTTIATLTADISDAGVFNRTESFLRVVTTAPSSGTAEVIVWCGQEVGQGGGGSSLPSFGMDVDEAAVPGAFAAMIDAIDNDLTTTAQWEWNFQDALDYTPILKADVDTFPTLPTCNSAATGLRALITDGDLGASTAGLVDACQVDPGASSEIAQWCECFPDLIDPGVWRTALAQPEPWQHETSVGTPPTITFFGRTPIVSVGGDRPLRYLTMNYATAGSCVQTTYLGNSGPNWRGTGTYAFWAKWGVGISAIPIDNAIMLVAFTDPTAAAQIVLDPAAASAATAVSGIDAGIGWLWFGNKLYTITVRAGAVTATEMTGLPDITVSDARTAFAAEHGRINSLTLARAKNPADTTNMVLDAWARYGHEGNAAMVEVSTYPLNWVKGATLTTGAPAMEDTVLWKPVISSCNKTGGTGATSHYNVMKLGVSYLDTDEGG